MGDKMILNGEGILGILHDTISAFADKVGGAVVDGVEGVGNVISAMGGAFDKSIVALGSAFSGSAETGISQLSLAEITPAVNETPGKYEVNIAELGSLSPPSFGGDASRGRGGVVV